MGRKYTRKRGLWRTRRSAAGGRAARDELVVLYLAGLDEAERPVKVAGGRVAGRVAQCAGTAGPGLQQAAGEGLESAAAEASSAAYTALYLIHIGRRGRIEGCRSRW